MLWVKCKLEHHHFLIKNVFMSITEIKNMTTSERLEAMEMLWDAICHDGDDVESPAWHAEVLAERKKRIESGEAKFYTLDQLKERFHR